MPYHETKTGDGMENIDWTNILTAVLLAIIGAVVPAFIKRLQAETAYQLARAKSYHPEITEWLTECADFAVKAAEQTGLAGMIEDKKQYALSIAEAWLEAKGIPIDLHLLDAAIEKAVLENFPHDGETKPVGFDK
jgi:hypothetical protein